MPVTSKPESPEEPLVDVKDAEKAASNGHKKTSFKDLLAKRRRTDVVKIPSVDEDGKPTTLEIKIRAIGGVDYDELLSAHKPTNEQKAQGAIFNGPTFIPALISACTTDPKLSYSEAQELYNSDEWSGGEISAWFIACQRVNNGDIDIPFNASA
jgi:hypothetical protein